ncbi:hypothetical protein CEXT_455601 [Caerostris extrusa]|uniref:Uncharacterized protein n=1 Tax=Caerostris extrusa TaxID=172846 RepID=A0AAV4Y2X9_CAEEX|nr:hypothetical protein CEXT_455601 [Caerostris extrusa]
MDFVSEALRPLSSRWEMGSTQVGQERDSIHWHCPETLTQFRSLRKLKITLSSIASLSLVVVDETLSNVSEAS